MISKGPTVYQTSYGFLREMLRSVLWTIVESGSDTGDRMGSVRWRACAALYSLVEGHPVDRRGRCRSCRRPGAVLGRVRRRCQVRVSACYWLHQPDETLLLDLLVRELNQHPRPSPGAGEGANRSGSGHAAPAAGPDTTDVLPRVDLDQDDPSPQALAVPRPPLSGGGSPQAGRSAEHGGAGKHRLRRSSPEDPPAEPLQDHGADHEQGHREVRLLPDPGGWPATAEWPIPRWRPAGAVSAGTIR
ncbi:MAG: hypothetical protein ACRDTF_03270 [Pseudonocardiaceae bacterium]